MAKPSVKETLKILLHLQDIDSKLAELKVSKVFYPRLLEDLRGEIVTLKERLSETKTKILDFRKEIDLKNLSIEENKEKFSNGQQRLLSVKSNKEYDAVQKEIQASEEHIAQIEEETIRLMEELDIEMKLEKALLEELETKEHSNVIQIDEIEKKYSAIENTVAKIQRDRDENAMKIDRKILTTYERIADGTQGHAVVKVVNRACGGCFQSLPPKLCQSIRRQDRINICEACGRILVWDDDVSV
jgi:predicted  nucleic acid-binding Zn-ribbon protein